MSRDVELQNLLKLQVFTVDGKDINVTVPIVGENELSVTDIHTKVCRSLGLQKTSSVWFSLFCGKKIILKRLKPETFITPDTVKDITLRKWCLNKEIEAQLVKDDPVACHLVYLEAKAAISNGLLNVSPGQQEKLEEYDDSAFKLEEKYVQLAQTFENYFSITIKDCKITCDEFSRSTPQILSNGIVRVSLDGIRLYEDNKLVLLEWKRLKKWLIHNKLSRITLLYISPGGAEDTVVIETCQCEYLLSAINQMVKELQVSSPSDSFFYSSMISTNDDGSRSYENALFRA